MLVRCLLLHTTGRVIFSQAPLMEVATKRRLRKLVKEVDKKQKLEGAEAEKEVDEKQKVESTEAEKEVDAKQKVESTEAEKEVDAKQKVESTEAEKEVDEKQKVKSTKAEKAVAKKKKKGKKKKGKKKKVESIVEESSDSDMTISPMDDICGDSDYIDTSSEEELTAQGRRSANDIKIVTLHNEPP
ncbi:hypothetical protein TSUD_353830 [Trifolium subterraneum]|uniref:Uncharacterized protein n=1 Tax=Trifolium subterraneum TaxID=3900 RepID=A0A2Z6M1Z5_TRISU|nr:hypothetical protein TSUD_353830 [Trifolium subterraneum]